jgi:hypothetical protein
MLLSWYRSNYSVTALYRLAEGKFIVRAAKSPRSLIKHVCQMDDEPVPSVAELL